ncbi:hydroxyacylglutathione hydrolase [Longimycelium tulufanense]|uniref:Hydroxyacylglutathione hydrolase n=1 Tax=Longimycelium tulufanense TaxID=907463 RepID=A0A8J3CEQ1_9PSEU|nr:FAD/NAD(P)-binding protein [Longimycelium tulufanense]GGM49612.1 hydroxyacylglutathione hydrolase [Longimycelium tulufanense]
MKLGIIGGGGAAASLLDALNRTSCRDLEITLFEPAKNLGQGRAYQPDTDLALLNVPAGRMSLREDDPRHFVRWVGTQPTYRDLGPVDEKGFFPRRIFGEYLASCVSGAMNDFADRGRPVRLVDSAVMAARTDGPRLDLRTVDGTLHRGFDRIVLCTGTGAPADVYHLAGEPGFIPDPYPLWTQLAGIPDTCRVLVLGTGLTAVDTVLFLLHTGHRGRIIMASRKGLLPAVRGATSGLELRHLSLAALRAALDDQPVMTCARLLHLLRAELVSNGVDLAVAARDFHPGEDPHRRLRRQVRQAASGVNTWQNVVVQATLSSVETLWHAMPARERERFLARWHQTFNSMLSPMPPQTAARLLTAMDEGQLVVRRGLVDVRSFGRGFLAHTAYQDTSADIVVNTVRPETGVISSSATALVGSLVGQGLASRHPHGGVAVDPDTDRVLGATGATGPKVFALGHLTCGTHYYTSSMLMIRRRAAVVADMATSDAH